ncbi:glycosyltransferase [Cellulomonas sp.]|uniref:glycosyltransferase n=1 Tax=Cellulomonas sp. TaxID=40001 RepID=UPI00258EEA58|nr:glycosyltransferase [Cellulomonas sp.]MCR6688011.1 glycosyltransferase [Cellulomonas sp.]
MTAAPTLAPPAGRADPALPRLTKERDQMFTVLVVDPLAVPVARWLARRTRVSPNAVTLVALTLGLAAAGAFAAGWWRAGGALFLARFFVDCLDGKVARARGTSSRRGAALDLAADVVGILACTATFGWALTRAGTVPSAAAVGLVTLVGTYNWALQYRKQLAAATGQGDGGAGGRLPREVPGLGWWVRFAQRRDMSPLPWAVEVEVLALGLLPLLAPAGALAWAVWGALAFYALATAVNLARVWRLAARADAGPATDPHRPGTRSKEGTTVPTTAPGTLPTTTVVIATHNRPELMRVAVAAVRAQEYDGVVETVVVFDGAEPDPTVADDDPLRPVRVTANTERTRGLAGARNTGILAASGDLVAFCDDDDEWLPGKLDAQVRQLLADGADTSVTGIVVVYEDHETPRIPLAHEMTVETLASRRVMAAHPSSVVVRRSALLGPIGLVDEEIPGSYGEDFDWMLRAAQAGPISVVSEPLVRVRWGQSLFSQRWDTIVAAIDYGVAKHQVLRSSRSGMARLMGRRAFALAALGRRRESAGSAWRAFRYDWRERRTYLALLVVARVVSAERAMAVAHRRGHGI